MKIGIISDTHDNLSNVEKALEILKQHNTEKIIFAGDLVSPFVINIFKKFNQKVIGVFGNNEGEKVFIKQKFSEIGEIFDGATTFQLDNKKFFLTHYDHIAIPLFGHSDFDYIIYGHTHKIDIQKNQNQMLINPGECCGLLTGKASIVILDTVQNEAELIYI